MSIGELKNDALSFRQSRDDWSNQQSYRCHICIAKEEDGSYSALVLNLPGCGSCGDTEEQAIENAREAILGAIESYTESGDDIPWKDISSDDIPEGAKLKWILVHA